MPNNIQTVKAAGTIISKMAAKMLADNMQFIKSIDKESDESFSQVNGYNPGDTININKPARFKMNSGADITAQIQDVVEEKVPLVLNRQRNVAVNLSSAEIATDLGLKSWAKRILEPAMSGLAQGIESEVLQDVKNSVYNTTGTPGSTLYDTDLMLSNREKLMKNLVPSDNELKALLESSAMRSAVNARKGLFQSSEEISKQYKRGYMGESDGYTFLENNLLPVHTRGTATGAITVTGAPTEGASTINLTGTGTQTLVVGDVFTIANVFQVHPITKVVTNQLQQFVVRANNTAAAGAYTAVQVSPAFYSATSLTLQNISALPAPGAAVTLVGAASTGYTNNVTFHKSAFRFASVPLVKPDGLDMIAQETVDGITVRVIRDYLPLTDKMVMRLDVLYGFAAVRPEWATRIFS
ncbi:hypothetical protein LZD49_33515 [Dyadobacter sp. CY261]|uniref:P22 phage major capsid protein family protein n=1 Tax=Dyadobacter sp. CY261 TaxID=2907203 RepID=UPI001F3CC0A8|nr:P22 phage major capsid protein family protein [Dyadobacter sp. CY261]MCF0075446.1 hypothetical protein [Dyadobacter sp. CY261]